MPAYQYTALNSRGRKQRSVIEADSSRSANQLLRQRGLVPLEIIGQQESDQQETSSFFRNRKLKIVHLALFTRQLSTLISAGLPIEDSLAAIAAQTENFSVRNQVAALRSAVREGHSLADALRRQGKNFSNLYCATVAAGEKSGHLAAVLQRLADYTESQLEFRQKIQLALVYPILLVVLSILIVLGLMIYVVPDVVEVILESGQELPLMTSWLITTSNFTLVWGWLVLIVLSGLAALFSILFREPKRRCLLHRYYLSLPLIRSYSRSSNAVRYVGTLGILTQSGVALVDAMKVASDVTTNQYFRQQVIAALEKVKAGVSLQSALSDTSVFPPMMLHLIASGEATGELSQMLARAAQTQEAELQRRVATLVGLFEPITLIVMGIIVLGIVLAILMPILNLNQLIQ